MIRGMTRLGNEWGAINLSQGFPDFDPPKAVLEAAERAERMRLKILQAGDPVLREGFFG